jgi:multiple sugar transport system substrate-binding protein
MKKKNTVLLLLVAVLLLGSQFIYAAGQQDAEEGGETTLVIWSHVTSHLIDFINELTPQFEADNPGVTIEYSAIEFAGYSTKLITAFAGGGGPDVYDINAVTKGAFEPKGMLAPLDLDAMGYASQNDFVKEWVPGSLNPYMSRDGELLGIPYDLAVWQLYLNDDYFKKAGLDPVKDAPETWEDFYSVSEQIFAKTGIKGYQLPLGISFGWYLIIWEPMLWQNGGQIFNPDGSSALDTAGTRKAFEMWNDILNDRKTGCTVEYEGDSPVYDFAAGNSAMTIAGPFGNGTIASVGSDKVMGKYSVVPLPQVDPNNPITTMNSWGWYLNKNSKQVDLGSKFIKYYADHGMEAYMTGQTIPLLDVFNSDEAKATFGYDIFKAGMAHTRPREGTPYYDETGNAIKKALDDYIMMGQNLDSVVTDLHKTIDKIQAGE